MPFVINIFKFLFSLVFLASAAFSSVTIRTMNPLSDNKVFVSFDFEVPSGQHINAPSDTSSGDIAPNVTFRNAKIVRTFWPQSKHLEENDSEGYDCDFSVIYELMIDDKSKPVEYDLFYVVCGDACFPKDMSGILMYNGLLSEEEISKAFGTEGDSMSIASWGSLSLMMVLAFLGGLILNFMPCVFPIISMKIFSIMRIASEAREVLKKQAFAFSIGIICTILGLYAILSCLRSSTIPGIGWGFYMQEPLFVVSLLILFLLCALNFWGLFDFSLIRIKGIKLPVKSIYVSSFFSGVFGALASSSCVGPFSGVALASALLYGNFVESFLIFLSLGIGLSFPFLVIALFPSSVHKFPKPGDWLKLFKEFMGFAMLLSALWPVSILMDQVSPKKLVTILICLVFSALFIWMMKHLRKRRCSSYLARAGLIGSIIICLLSVSNTTDSGNVDSIIWQDYDKGLFQDARKSGKAIFLNFTAGWCMNCQFNQRLFSDPEIIKAFKDADVIPIKCDWTNRNKEIADLMGEYKSVAVPLYVFYRRDSEDFIVLPTFLTKGPLLEVIRE